MVKRNMREQETLLAKELGSGLSSNIKILRSFIGSDTIKQSNDFLKDEKFVFIRLNDNPVKGGLLNEKGYPFGPKIK